MPVTKTAKRALRSSARKAEVNKKIISSLEISLRMAKKNNSEENVRKVISNADKAAKKNVIHKNKAARIKSSISKLLKKDGKTSVSVRSTKSPKVKASTSKKTKK